MIAGKSSKVKKATEHKDLEELHKKMTSEDIDEGVDSEPTVEDKLDSLIDVFKEASHSSDASKKLDELMDQNNKIAQALVKIHDMIETLDKKYTGKEPSPTQEQQESQQTKQQEYNLPDYSEIRKDMGGQTQQQQPPQQAPNPGIQQSDGQQNMNQQSAPVGNSPQPMAQQSQQPQGQGPGPQQPQNPPQPSEQNQQQPQANQPSTPMPPPMDGGQKNQKKGGFLSGILGK